MLRAKQTSLLFSTLNCRRIPAHNRYEFICEIDDHISFDVIALQEISISIAAASFDSRGFLMENIRGHMLIICRPSSGSASIGFLVHRSLSRRICLGKTDFRCASIKLNFENGFWATFISSHFTCTPDLEEFDRCLEALDRIIPESNGCSIFIGVDANAVLGDRSHAQVDQLEFIGESTWGSGTRRESSLQHGQLHGACVSVARSHVLPHHFSRGFLMCMS